MAAAVGAAAAGVTLLWPTSVDPAIRGFGVVLVSGAVFALAALARRRSRRDATGFAVSRASEARFRDYAETAADWYWESGPDHTFVHHPEMIRGVDVDPASRLGRHRWDVAADLAEEPAKWQAHRSSLDRHEPFHDFVYRVTQADGACRHVSVSGKPVFDGDGRFLGYRGSGRDVTDAVIGARDLAAAKQAAEFAEAVAAEARARLTVAIETMPQGFVLFDAEDRLVICNNRYRSLYPLTGDRLIPGTRFEDMMRESVRCGEFLHAIGREESWVAERLAKHAEAAAELEQRTADGRWIQVQERRLADGSSVGLRIDITDLKRREERLRLSEERFRDFAQTSSDWFWEQDSELRFSEFLDVSHNPDVPLRATLGKRRWEIETLGATPEQWAAHRADLAARRPFRDFRYHRRGTNGDIRHMSISGTPVFDAAGAFAGYRGVGRDITAQVHAEGALRVSEERFRDFARVSSDWFWEQDAELRFSHFADNSNTPNRRFQELLGKTRRQAVGAGVGEAALAAHEADLLTRRPFRDFRYQRVGPQGDMRHVSVAGVPLFDPDGGFRGYRGTARDITAQVRGEAALRVAKDEAEAASRTKSQFLANMSHELRTPLNAILGFSEVIRDMLMGPLPPRYRDYAADIHKAGQHLLSLIGDVLDLSKIEVGRLELHEEPVPLPELFESCRRLIMERAREQGVSIELVLPADLPPVLADRLRLKQILLNLLSNAVKFTQAGGRVVLAATAASDGGLVLSVTDSGIGMRAEDIPMALAPFQQIDGALSRRYEGTGLGLPLSKTLAELHSGRLEIESQPDRGTIVRVYLPATRLLRAAA